jgi:small subunit ribosomal protein S1
MAENHSDDFDFEKAYQDSFKEFEENTVVTAKVIQITDETVFVDFGYKAEGKIPVTEFKKLPEVGDDIDVYIVKLESNTGEPVVSKQRAESILHMKELKGILDREETIEGTVVSVERGGLLISYHSILGFIPFRLFDVQRVNNPEIYVGKPVTVYVEKLGKGGRNGKEDFVANRRKFINNQRSVDKEQFFADKNEGDVIEGLVKNITDFGAFLDIGGVDALLHIKDLAWAKVARVEDVVQTGQTLNVKILRINKETGKVSVGLKQMQDDPWDTFVADHNVGDVVVGSVVSIVTYGAFVRVMDGVEGLLHISDMSWVKSVKNPKDLVEVGQNIEVKIVNIDNEKRNINLSLKHLLDNPWDEAAKKYQVGTKLTGKVKSITSFGVFVEIEEGIDALLHVDDISWTERIKNIKDHYTVDDQIEVVVLQFDTENNKIKVGVKQLEDNPWNDLANSHSEGGSIECTVTHIDENRGIEVALNDDIKAFIPLSQVSSDRIDDIKASIKSNFSEGETITATILTLDIKRQRVILSIKEHAKNEEKKKVQAYLHNEDEDSSYTLGDALNMKQDD